VTMAPKAFPSNMKSFVCKTTNSQPKLGLDERISLSS
jgi:hypothetical protein